MGFSLVKKKGCHSLKNEEDNAMKKIIIAVLFLTLFGTNAIAGGAISGGASEVTQILNHVELGSLNGTEIAALKNQAEQLINEAMMIQNQLENLKIFDFDSFPTIPISTIESLANIVDQGQIISYVASNIDEQVASLFLSYATYKTAKGLTSAYIQGKLTGWNKQTKDAVIAVLKAANLQEQTIVNERTRLNYIKDLSSTASGNLQVTQATNMIAAEQVQSLQRLRLLLMDQSQLHANYYAIEQDKEVLRRSNWQEKAGTRSPASNINNGENYNNIIF